MVPGLVQTVRQALQSLYNRHLRFSDEGFSPLATAEPQRAGLEEPF